MSRVFGAKSLSLLANAHPLLVKVLTRALEIGPEDFSINETYRSKADQEAAVARGNSKVHYPNSAHNQTKAGKPCACAADVLPFPFYGWEDKRSLASWRAISEAMQRAATELGTAIRWGGDFNRDGAATTSDAWDKPHFELHPWRNHTEGR